jgi:hypothetical protein
MRSRNMIVVSLAVVVVALAIFGTVAFGIYSGLADGQHRKAAATPAAVVTGSAPRLSRQDAATNVAAAPGEAIAQPAPGAFSPGSPPVAGGGVAADGISAWGVAYKEVSDANAQADAALVKAAYQDAEKKAGDLASATGNKLGRLVALTDYSADQPYFKPCVQNSIPPQGKPLPEGSGSGSAGSATSSGPAVAIAPAPCQVTGNNRYLVVWVYVRHAL